MNYLSEKYDTTDFLYFTSRDYTQCREPLLKEYDNVTIDPKGTFSVSPAGVNAIGESVVYFGYFSTPHFGKWLIDYLSVFWWKPSFNAKYVYTSDGEDVKDYPYAVRLLKLAGVDTDCVLRIAQPMTFCKVYAPEASFVHDKYILPVFATIYSKIVHNLPVNVPAYEKSI